MFHTESLFLGQVVGVTDGQESNTKYTIESADVEGEILGRDGKSPPSE